jgi:transposase
MEKIDARQHSPETQYEIRKQVIRLRKKGISNQDVAQGVGLSQSHTSTIWQRYQKEGSQAIQLGQRGRRTGEKRSLTPSQETEIQRLLIDKTPDQLKLAFALWTREAVRLLIKKLYRMEMPIRTVGTYLQRWGFTPQKPVKRAYEQNPQVVQHWLETEYPRLVAQAKQEKAVIHWGDETGLQTDAYRTRGFAPKGKTPVVRLPAKKSSVNMISAITNQGLVRFMMYRDNMTSQLLIKFMSRLVKDTGHKVFLILDNLRSHHSNKVKEWLENHQKEIKVFYLPAYAPELNPDEYLNGDLKARVHSGQPPRSQNDLEHKTRSFMRTLLKRPKHVRSYFQHSRVKYAA